MEENCIGYTLVQHARINGANPLVWLTDVITWAPRYEAEGRDLKELLFPYWFDLPRVKEMESRGVLVRVSTPKDVTAK